MVNVFVGANLREAVSEANKLKLKRGDIISLSKEGGLTILVYFKD